MRRCACCERRGRAVVFLSPLLTLGCAIMASAAQVVIEPPTYQAARIEAWVVDARTRAPLDGVIVVAHWQLEPESDWNKQMMVMETVTDTEGRFTFPAWGPKPRPLWGVLRFRDPQLLLFKKGYLLTALQNRALARGPSHSPSRACEWTGKTIPLARFQGDEAEYGKTLSQAARLVGFAVDEDCSWKRMPRLLAAMHEEAVALKAAGHTGALERPQTIAELEGTNNLYRAKCGSLESLLHGDTP